MKRPSAAWWPSASGFRARLIGAGRQLRQGVAGRPSVPQAGPRTSLLLELGPSLRSFLAQSQRTTERLGRLLTALGEREAQLARDDDDQVGTWARPPELLRLSANIERQLMLLLRHRDVLGGSDPLKSLDELRAACRRLGAAAWAFQSFVGQRTAEAALLPLEKLQRALGKLHAEEAELTDLGQRLRQSRSEDERLALRYLLARTEEQRIDRLRGAERRLKKVEWDELVVAQRAFWDAVALRAQAPSANFGLLAGLAVERALGEVAPGLQADMPLGDDQLRGLNLGLTRLRHLMDLLGPDSPESKLVLSRLDELRSLLGAHQNRVKLQKSIVAAQRGAKRRGHGTVLHALGGVMHQVQAERERLEKQFNSRDTVLDTAALHRAV